MMEDWVDFGAEGGGGENRKLNRKKQGKQEKEKFSLLLPSLFFLSSSPSFLSIFPNFCANEPAHR